MRARVHIRYSSVARRCIMYVSGMSVTVTHARVLLNMQLLCLKHLMRVHCASLALVLVKCGIEFLPRVICLCLSGGVLKMREWKMQEQ